MSADTLILYFESACSSLQSLDPSLRHNAEIYLKQLHDSHSSDIYEFCFNVLHQSLHPLSLFHALSILKHVFVRDFPLLSISNINLIRTSNINFLMKGIKRNSTSNLDSEDDPRTTQGGGDSFVLNQAIHLLSISIKRDPNAYNDCLSYIKHLTPDPNITPISLLPLHLCRSLLEEFSLSSFSSLSLPWEFHIHAHHRFQENVILPLFQFLSTQLKSCVSSPSTPAKYTSLLFEVIGQVLNWEFADNSSKLITSLTGDNRIRTDGRKSITSEPFISSIQLPELWKPILLGNSDLISILLSCYSRLRSESVSSHRARLCLIQLASLRGDDVSHCSNITKVILYFMELLLPTSSPSYEFPSSLQHNQNHQVELFDLAQICLRFFTGCSLNALVLIQTPTFEQLCIQLAFFLCSLLSFDFASVDIEDSSWISDVIDIFLETFDMLFLQYEQLLISNSSYHTMLDPPIFLLSIASEIVDRSFSFSLRERQYHYQHDYAEETKEIYFERLKTIASIARFSAKTCLIRIKDMLQEWFCHFNQQHECSSSNSSIATILPITQLLLYLGFFIADNDNLSEIPQIPRCILSLSYNQQTCNILLDVINFMFSLVALEPQLYQQQQQQQNNINDFSVALLLLIRRWCSSYLMLDESLYMKGQLSQQLLDAFASPSTDSSIQVLDYVIQKIIYPFNNNNIKYFNDNNNSIIYIESANALRLLVSSSHSHGIRNALKHSYSSKWNNFVISLLLTNFNNLEYINNNFILTDIIYTISQVAFVDDDDDYYEIQQQHSYSLSQVIKALEPLIISGLTLQQQKETITIRILYIILGLVKVTGQKRFLQVFTFISNFFPYFTTIIQSLSSDICHVLFHILLNICMKELINLNINHIQLYINTVINVISVYSETLLRRMSAARLYSSFDDSNIKANNTIVHDDSFEDVEVFVELLILINEKDFSELELHLGDSNMNINSILYSGISFLIPHCSFLLDTLHFTDIVSSVLIFILEIFQMHPSYMSQFYTENDARETLYNLIEMCCQHHELTVATSSFLLLQGIANFHSKSISSHMLSLFDIPRFQHFTLRFAILGRFDIALCSNISETLYKLVLCNPHSFEEVASRFVSEQQLSDEVKYRFANALQTLCLSCKNLGMKVKVKQQQQIRAFGKAFTEFVPFVRSFLLEK